MVSVVVHGKPRFQNLSSSVRALRVRERDRVGVTSMPCSASLSIGRPAAATRC
jgi:hypothetical protein